jgi:hypothetical protein
LVCVVAAVGFRFCLGVQLQAAVITTVGCLFFGAFVLCYGPVVWVVLVVIAAVRGKATVHDLYGSPTGV